MTDTVVAAGLPALGTMLTIAIVALVLGLGALWLSRRHHDREVERHREAERHRSHTDDPPPPG